MEKYNCIIVEDEPLAAGILEDYIRQVPFLDLHGIFPDAILAMEFLRKQEADVIFLDIHLPKLKGFDFIKILDNHSRVIVTTAYRDYAIEGYELDVLDYLVKPIPFNRFLMAVNKLKSQSNPAVTATDSLTMSNGERAHLFINVNKKIIKVYLDEILYIESKKEYIRIVAGEKSFLTKFQLGDMEAQLAPTDFLRVHRSFLVSKARIEAYTATHVQIAGHQIPIGRSYKELVNTRLGRK